MSQYVGPPLAKAREEEVEREVARMRANPILFAVRFLEDMRESGSWDKPTLDRAIEFISKINP